jgi:hypothetical protein
LAAAALVDESWAIADVRSPEHWLTMQAGLSPFRAKAIVAVARRSGDLPTVMAEFAVYASVPQLRRALTHYCFDPPAEPGHAQQITTFATEARQRPSWQC